MNLSARSLLDVHFPDEVAGLLARYDVNPALLELEITESSLMSDPSRALDILSRLDRMGVLLTIDDFGTGYSSLGYLKSLPVHTLKVDRSFVLAMTANANDAVIVRSTVDLSRNLDLLVVAEGVKDEGTLSALVELGCEQVQGNYFTPPLPAAALASWLDAAPARSLR